jgi:hypothetical protein
MMNVEQSTSGKRKKGERSTCIVEHVYVVYVFTFAHAAAVVVSRNIHARGFAEVDFLFVNSKALSSSAKFSKINSLCVVKFTHCSAPRRISERIRIRGERKRGNYHKITLKVL